MGAEQSKTQKSLSQSIDYLAANYILTSNFQDLKDLSDASSCKELVVLTSDVLNKYLTEKDVSFLQQRMEGTEEKNYMTKKSLAYFNEGKINDMDVKSDLQKKRMCLGIAKFYIRIFHVFNAIAHTVNPEYTWTDMYGQKHKVGYEDKSKIPRDAKYTITKMNLCSEKMNALIDKANLDIIKEDDNSKNIDITPKFCGINVSKSGGTANLQEEPGMPELEKLYYDQYNYSTGKFQSMSPDMKEVYMEDVKTLYKAFTGKKESMPDTIKSFSDIRLRDFENIVQCQNNGVFTKTYTGSLKEKQFLAYAENIRLMQKNTLENQQVLMNILDKLFAFTPNPQEKGKKMVTIHPNLNEKSLDKIVADTRTAILKMYSTCEKDFYKGLQLFEAIVWKQMLDTSVKQIDNLNQDIDNALYNTGAQANRGPRVDGTPGDKGIGFPDHFQRPGQLQPPGYQENVGDRGVGAQEGDAAGNMTPGKVRIKRVGKNNGDESSSESENSDEEDNKINAIEKKLANSPTEVRKPNYSYKNPIPQTDAPNFARYGKVEESEVDSRFDNENARSNKRVTFSSYPVNNNGKGSVSAPAADAPRANVASTDAVAVGTSNTTQGFANVNVKVEPGATSPPAQDASSPPAAPDASVSNPAPPASAISSPVKDAPSCTSDPFKVKGTCVLGEHGIYIDKQVGLYCGMHAINNLFGLEKENEKIKSKDMKEACKEGNRKTTERFLALGIPQSEHEIEKVCAVDGGNCNISVVVDILEKVIPERLDTQINLVIMPEYQIQNIGERSNLRYDRRDQNCISSQVNTTEDMVGCIVSLNQQGHFAAFRFIRDGYYFIDSLTKDIMYYKPNELTDILMDEEIINGIIIVRKGGDSRVYTCMELDKENAEVRKNNQEVLKELLKSKPPLDESPSKSGITPVDTVDLTDAQEDEATSSKSSLDDENLSFQSEQGPVADDENIQSDSSSQDYSDVTMDIDPTYKSGEHAKAEEQATPVEKAAAPAAAATPPATDSSTAAAPKEGESTLGNIAQGVRNLANRVKDTTYTTLGYFERPKSSQKQQPVNAQTTDPNTSAQNRKVGPTGTPPLSRSESEDSESETNTFSSSLTQDEEQAKQDVVEVEQDVKKEFDDLKKKIEDSGCMNVELKELNDDDLEKCIELLGDSVAKLDNKKNKFGELYLKAEGKLNGNLRSQMTNYKTKTNKRNISLKGAKTRRENERKESEIRGTSGGARSKKKKHSKKHRKNSRKKSRSMKRIKKLKK